MRVPLPWIPRVTASTLPAMEDIKLTRKDLFDLVWSTPMTKLAANYGISDVALRKKCHKHQIPTPRVGHWARVAAGHRVARPKFKPVDGALNEIVIQPMPAFEAPKEPPPDVPIPSQLRNPHEAVVFIKQGLETDTLDRNGRLVMGDSWSPEFCIHPSSVPRALRLVQALVAALEKRGHQVRVEPWSDNSNSPSVMLHVGGERLRLKIEERLKKRPHELSADERKTLSYYPEARVRKWDYHPEGDLTLDAGGYRTAATIRDAKKWRLEEQLGGMILNMEMVAKQSRELRAEDQRREAERLRAERARLRERRLAVYQEWLAQDLEAMCEHWEKSTRLLAFLAAYEAGLQQHDAHPEWLAAAKRYARRLDPLSEIEKVPKVLEPPDEELERIVAEFEEHRRRQASARRHG